MSDRSGYERFFDIGFADETSRRLFDHIMRTRLFGNEETFIDGLVEDGLVEFGAAGRSEDPCSAPDLSVSRWFSYELESAMRHAGCSEVILYGAGFDGRINKKVMDICGMPVKCFCDRDLRGSVLGARVISADELPRAANENTLIVISSRKYSQEIRSGLLESGIDEKNILIPKEGVLTAGTSRQYFDVFTPVDDEVFVDGGAFRGETSRLFTEFAGQRYEKIYAFEPGLDFEETGPAKFIPRLEWHRQALWDKDETLTITGTGEGAEVRPYEGSGPCIPGVTLDSVLDGRRASFIKLDVEGSELRALRGAEHTIRTHRPRIAVSVYHRKEDIVTIAQYLRSLIPDYGLRLRHYHTNYFETILYCN